MTVTRRAECRALGALALLAGLAPAAFLAGPALAQTASDSTSAPADTTDARELISTDGAISVFEEARPGEGIEGFWWEYDPEADLERLLDRNRQDLPLEPLRDGFGFELAIPDTIRGLRDSVRVVADSIRAERIDFTVIFDPKLTSTYTETKDRYVLSNSFESDYPLVTDGALNVKITDNREFNESTKKVSDGRRVNTSFNYLFNPDLVSTLRVGWAEDFQETSGIKDSESDNVTAGGTLKKTVGVGVLGRLEASGGISGNRRAYGTARLDGVASQFQPDWKAKLIRDFPRGNLTLEYEGNYGLSTREERRRFSGTDTLGNTVDTTAVDQAEETNYGNTFKGELSRKWAGTELRLTSSIGDSQFQYLSQVDSLIGQKETRTRDFGDAVLTATSKPTRDIDLIAKAEYHRDETAFELDDGKTRGSTRRLANVDLKYRSWEGGAWAVKMERSAERRDFRTNQAGDVIKQKGSVDFKQAITERVDLQASYFATLDRFEFDQERSPSERDLRTQRGTFDVRYTPTAGLNAGVKMEVRKTDSVNLFPPNSGDNDTEHGFTMTPSYNWTIGKASLRGDFTADARYKVQDYLEDDNTLNRRFALRQSWQHKFTDRLTTETQFHWEF
ncbi:MAG TPA: hypothetical protein VKU85_01455, partial [bacterium]|nr:hypothetical protein [bacterium]